MGRNGAGEEDPACRATAAPPMGVVKGLQAATKEAPTWARGSGVQVGREKPWLPPFKPLSNTTHKLEE